MSELFIIVSKMVDRGFYFSMDTSKLYCLITKPIVLSLKYVDKMRLWDVLFPMQSGANHVDWSLLKDNFNALDEIFYWMPLVESCHWKDTHTFVSKHPPLRHMKAALKKAQIDTDDMDLACRMIIIYLLQNIPVLHAFKTLTCRLFNRDTGAQSTAVLASLSDHLHTPAEYESMFLDILSPQHLTIETQKLQECIDTLNSQHKEIRGMAETQKKSVVGRPRLRDLLDASSREKLDQDTRLGTWETYQAFCQTHQFPNVLSDIIKQKLYFLAAQTRWDWGPQVATLLGHQGELSERVAQYPVSLPDLEVIHKCILRFEMNGRAPFPLLVAFKNKCFINFPTSQFQLMILTHFLRLFICIYQNPKIWKELWKWQGVLYSPQVVKDCEAFVLNNPFPVQDVMPFFI